MINISELRKELQKLNTKFEELNELNEEIEDYYEANAKEEFVCNGQLQRKVRKYIEEHLQNVAYIKDIRNMELLPLNFVRTVLINEADKLEDKIQLVHKKIKSIQPTLIGDALLDFEEEEEEEKWLIKGVIPSDSIGEIYGETKSYKSFTVLDMLYCICNGLNWHGKDVQQGNVVYVAAEGRNGLGKRIAGLEHVYNQNGELLGVHENFFAPSKWNLLDESAMYEAGTQLDAIGDVKIVVIDTLRRNAPTMNESEASHWSEILGNLETYIKPHMDVILWVHHTNKGKNGSSGTYSRKADSDFYYSLTRQKSSMKTILECEKLKDEEDGWKLEFELVKTLDTLTPQLYNKEVKSKLSDKAKEVFDTLSIQEKKIIKENNLLHDFTHDELKEAVHKSCADKTLPNQRKILSRITNKYDLKA